MGQQPRHARLREAQAITLADDVALLARWLREDILVVNGLSYVVRQAELQQALRGRCHAVCTAVACVAATVVRATSVVENVNSRLRNYFFLRR